MYWFFSCTSKLTSPTCCTDGRRLSKRNHDLDLGVLRPGKTPEEILGFLACGHRSCRKRRTSFCSTSCQSLSWDVLRARKRTRGLLSIFQMLCKTSSYIEWRQFGIILGTILESWPRGRGARLLSSMGPQGFESRLSARIFCPLRFSHSRWLL